MNPTATADPTFRSVTSGAPLPTKPLAGFVAAFMSVAAIALLSYQSLQTTTASAASLAQSIEVLGQLESLLSTVKDAETGQRGYLLTGDDSYLEPYVNARRDIGGEFAALHTLLVTRPEQRRRVDALQGVVELKLAELEKSVTLRRAGQTEAALLLVRTNHGKVYMDQIRSAVTELESSERRLIADRTTVWRSAAAVSLAVTLGGAGILLVLILAAAVVAARDYRARQLQSWARLGQMRLSERLQGDQTLEKLGNNLLGFLASFLDAQVGAVYIAEGGAFRQFAGYAIPADFGAVVRAGDGLVGQAARDNRAMHVRSVPQGYLPVASGTGQAGAVELLIAPASIDGLVQAVIELGFFDTAPRAKIEFLDRVGESIAVAVRASKDRQRLEELLQETQQQAEELQTGQEELRVTNEELEEQGRALRESQVQLEAQQAELEQINSQLEEQTQLLEHQKNALGRSHDVLAGKTVELQRANDYKSEFLANMSHELRTPLNSTLILAKLLADNKDGNLTASQVKFAQTIGSAGNDLLDLINDVLDLSRIEAGKVNVEPERTPISRLVEGLAKTFGPMAAQKRLSFATAIDSGVPATIDTDPQRLGQILKNLLSNAIKFTDTGSVQLQVSPAPAHSATDEQSVCFAIRDSGVGIAQHQHEVIFEAFRQADGSIHRKFGGTGLGLSISRDLAGLLGGTISVQSEPGKGSVFTLTLPCAFRGARPAEAVRRPSEAESYTPIPSTPPVASAGPHELAASPTEDDRDRATPGGRLIVVIEDDLPFSMILRDLVRERGFQCVLTHRAKDGVIAASRFLPTAIVLDINLPDHSGLGVLDQLKHDPRTRHIPVHVVSVSDYRREAMELGALGFALKPAQREQLIDAVKRLESFASQDLRRLLVVEDDARQRESICQLLANEAVRITAVASAAEALQELKSSTFDCMVMDFNLPDLSGYGLLEKMSQEEGLAFPPVIVYTGRALTREEEEHLRRYSRSIIIKGARSPERLLDEVTLFLHQVEAKLPADRQQMLKAVRDRESALDGKRVLVVEDDVRNVFALSSILEPKGVAVVIARNGREALDCLSRAAQNPQAGVDLVLMDIMMPEMDGFTAMREIRRHAEWRKLPIIALTAKAMKDDQEKCLAAGANDYIAKPLDVEKLLSLVRVWMPK